jgi:hypothetical protein
MPAVARELLPPKRIAVNGRPIRLRWLQQIIWSFLAANIGALIMVALYYLFVQLRWHVGGHTFLYLKPDWDNLFSFRGWAADRHDFRDVYEAILATLFVKSLLANWRLGSAVVRWSRWRFWAKLQVTSLLLADGRLFIDTRENELSLVTVAVEE